MTTCLTATSTPLPSYKKTASSLAGHAGHGRDQEEETNHWTRVEHR